MSKIDKKLLTQDCRDVIRYIYPFSDMLRHALLHYFTEEMYGGLPNQLNQEMAILNENKRIRDIIELRDDVEFQ